MAIHKIDGVDAVDGGSAINHFPKKFVTLTANGTISKNDWVAIDSATDNGLGSCVVVANSGTTGHDSLIFGIATEAATDGDLIRIQTAGKYDTANVQGDTAYGDALVASTVDGQATQADTLSAASASYAFVVCGVALEADTANLAAVLITDQGYF
tara:strand:- start:85 stop:549 length:465 start_codon:yes stop_codon:yes gene_type:complete